MQNHPRSESAASLRVDLALANDKATALERQAREAKADAESQSGRLRGERDAVAELAASLQGRLAAEKESHQRTRSELNKMVGRGQAEAIGKTPPSREKPKERERVEVEVELVRVKGELEEARDREAALSTRVGELLGRIGHVEAEMRGRVEEGEAEGMRRVQAARAEAESLRSKVMRLEETSRAAAQEKEEWRLRAEVAEGKSLVSERRALSVEQDAVELRVEVSRLTGQLARSRVFGGNQDGAAAREVARVLVGELEAAAVVGGGGGAEEDRERKKDAERLKGEVMRLEGDLARERIGRRDADDALGAQRVRAEALMDEVASLESVLSRVEVQLGAQVTSLEAALRRVVAGARDYTARSDSVRRGLEEENLRLEEEVREARRKAYATDEQLRMSQTAAEVGTNDGSGATKGTSHERRAGADENGDFGSEDEDKGDGEGNTSRSEKERVRQRGVMSALRRGLGRGASPSPRHRIASGRESNSLPR
jgi:hypothetical protein